MAGDQQYLGMILGQRVSLSWQSVCLACEKPWVGCLALFKPSMVMPHLQSQQLGAGSRRMWTDSPQPLLVPALVSWPPDLRDNRPLLLQAPRLWL